MTDSTNMDFPASSVSIPDDSTSGLVDYNDNDNDNDNDNVNVNVNANPLHNCYESLYVSMPLPNIGLPSHYPGSPSHSRKSFECGVLLEELQDFDDVFRRSTFIDCNYYSLNHVVVSNEVKNDGSDNDYTSNKRESSSSTIQSQRDYDGDNDDDDDLIALWMDNTSNETNIYEDEDGIGSSE